MKKYRLKKWYPGIRKDIKEDTIFEERKYDYIMYADKKISAYCAPKDEVENNPEFWEEVVEKALFTTHDGVDIYEGDQYYYVNHTYNPILNSYASKKSGNNKGKYFSTKEKAEEWIDKNKPQYSKNDIVNALEKTSVPYNWINNLFKELEK